MQTCGQCAALGCSAAVHVHNFKGTNGAYALSLVIFTHFLRAGGSDLSGKAVKL